MEESVKQACGETIASLAHDEQALATVIGQITSEDCTRENILGAAGLLSWAVAFAPGSEHAQELTKRIGLLTLVAFYSGGIPRKVA